VAVVNFRSCSGEPNLSPRAYHGGDTTELAWVLERFKKRWPLFSILGAGVSLGGNIFAKYLAEFGTKSIPVAAAAICSPLDLRACFNSLNSGFNRVYQWNFLRSLRSKLAAKKQTFPQEFSSIDLDKIRTIKDFDNLYIAPFHGFTDVEDYWDKSSSLQMLKTVKTPLLIVSALNDPFIPKFSIPTSEMVSKNVTLRLEIHGGHVGFLDQRNQKISYLGTLLENYFQNQVSSTPPIFR
jgi:predicted alpha/beta-fold hydrolase